MGGLWVRLTVTTVVLALATSAGLCADASDAPAEVDAAVVLVADVSRSIDDGEFALERRGYAEAIQSQKLLDAISTGSHGAIALAYVEWAGESEQMIVVDWAVIRNAADARAFAASLSGAPRSFVGRTAIGSAINFALALFSEVKFGTDRRVIDVSGDGTSNQGSPVTAARDAAVGAGATINGLTIFNRRAAAMGGYLALHTNPPRGLAQYYRDNVIGGTGAFVVPIDDFNSFATQWCASSSTRSRVGDPQRLCLPPDPRRAGRVERPGRLSQLSDPTQSAARPAALRMPATPSWLIRSPLAATAAAMALRAFPCARSAIISRIATCSASFRARRSPPPRRGMFATIAGFPPATPRRGDPFIV